jgi:hypothetical protein
LIDSAASTGKPTGNTGYGLQTGRRRGRHVHRPAADRRRPAAPYTAKVPSTPQDSSIGVLNGIEKICREAGIDPRHRRGHARHHGGHQHGADRLVGALVGLVTTKGYKDTLQIARSYVPGGLGGWVIWNKSRRWRRWRHDRGRRAHRRRGQRRGAARRGGLRRDLRKAADGGHRGADDRCSTAYVNGAHERAWPRSRRGDARHSGVDSAARSCRRCTSTSAPRPRWSTPTSARWCRSTSTTCSASWTRAWADVPADPALRRRPVLGAPAAMDQPVNLLMSGPAGGVSGALWIAKQRRLHRPADLRHGRHLHRRGADPERQRPHPARDAGRRRHRARAVHRRAHRGRRRRLHRLRAGADQGAARRPAVGRRRAGSRGLRQGRRPSRP